MCLYWQISDNALPVASVLRIILYLVYYNHLLFLMRVCASCSEVSLVHNTTRALRECTTPPRPTPHILLMILLINLFLKTFLDPDGDPVKKNEIIYSLCHCQHFLKTFVKNLSIIFELIWPRNKQSDKCTLVHNLVCGGNIFLC